MDHGAADCHPGCLGDPEHDLLGGVGRQLLADLPVADIQAQGWHLLADAELPRLAQVPSTLPPGRRDDAISRARLPRSTATSLRWRRVTILSSISSRVSAICREISSGEVPNPLSP